MSTMVPMYGFGGGSGGTGAALTVTAPAGCTVTVSKDGKTKTKTAGADGTAVFKGLSTGDWTLSITDGTQTAQKTVTITADYTAAITFFAATIHVTYPAGSTCTVSDGVTTLTAPDTRGTWDCVVPNAGTWTVSLDSGFAETATITSNGEEQTIDKWYILKNGALRAGYRFNTVNGCSSLTNDGITTQIDPSTDAWTLSPVFNLIGFTTIYFSIKVTRIQNFNVRLGFTPGHPSTSSTSQNQGNFVSYVDVGVTDNSFRTVSLPTSGGNGKYIGLSTNANSLVNGIWLEV